jgi:prophage maintenance system killer protein
MKKEETKDTQKSNDVVIYQSKSGAIELHKDLHNETIWATQAQIVSMFDSEQSVISKHIKNVFKDKEVSEKSNMQKMHIANSDKPVTQYSLDVILSVGYRTNSAKAIKFRQWATKTLRSHVVDGYTINPTRIQKNYEQFIQAVADVQVLLPPDTLIGKDEVLELVRLFADTWMSLDAYDKEALDVAKPTKKKVALTATKLAKSVEVLKTELIEKGEATELFATERERGSLEGIIGNVVQSFGGVDVYASIEEKASHLLYFIIKNHPFIDGNKRTGAYAFVWFLHQAKILDPKRLTPTALTAITLLIAESDPKDKEKMVKLVVMLISRK